MRNRIPELQLALAEREMAIRRFTRAIERNILIVQSHVRETEPPLPAPQITEQVT